MPTKGPKLKTKRVKLVILFSQLVHKWQSAADDEDV